MHFTRSLTWWHLSSQQVTSNSVSAENLHKPSYLLLVLHSLSNPKFPEMVEVYSSIHYSHSSISFITLYAYYTNHQVPYNHPWHLLLLRNVWPDGCKLFRHFNSTYVQKFGLQLTQYWVSFTLLYSIVTLQKFSTAWSMFHVIFIHITHQFMTFHLMDVWQ